MAAINLRLPPASDLGIGFWRNLQELLEAAKGAIEDNDVSEEDSDSDSSQSSDAINTFDPDVNTVTEFENAIQEIIDSLRGTE